MTSFYPALMGLPISICITLILFLFEESNRNFSKAKYQFLEHISYSLISSVFSLGSLIFLNLALSAEDATKVAIVKSSDVLFSFILQYLILDVDADVLSVIGAVSILTGTLLLALFKIVEKNVEVNKSCIFKILLYKF